MATLTLAGEAITLPPPTWAAMRRAAAVFDAVQKPELTPDDVFEMIDRTIEVFAEALRSVRPELTAPEIASRLTLTEMEGLAGTLTAYAAELQTASLRLNGRPN